MPNETGAETPAERLIRVRAEVARLRASIDAQIETGAEKATGVFRMTEVEFSRLEARLKLKERELALLEAAHAGDASGAHTALGFVTLATRSPGA